MFGVFGGRGLEARAAGGEGAEAGGVAESGGEVVVGLEGLSGT